MFWSVFSRLRTLEANPGGGRGRRRGVVAYLFTPLPSHPLKETQLERASDRTTTEERDGAGRDQVGDPEVKVFDSHFHRLHPLVWTLALSTQRHKRPAVRFFEAV